MTREPRDMDNREENARTQTWRPPETLPSPDPVPGWSFRWMRVSSLGETDTLNAGSYKREGWEVVAPAEVPELTLQGAHDGHADRVEIGGLVLVKIPSTIVQQRDKYYRDLANRQMDAVNSQLDSQSDPRMPLFRETKQTRGS